VKIQNQVLQKQLKKNTLVWRPYRSSSLYWLKLQLPERQENHE